MAKLLYFGKLIDVTGVAEEEVALKASIADTNALRAWLDETRGYSGALLEPSVRIAVNDELVPEPFAISDRDQVAFLPPVGGG